MATGDFGTDEEFGLVNDFHAGRSSVTMTQEVGRHLGQPNLPPQVSSQ
jgi:hypothetical protein